MRLPDRFQAKREDQLFWHVDPITDQLRKIVMALLIGALNLISFPVEAILRTNQGSRSVRVTALVLGVVAGTVLLSVDSAIGAFLLVACVLTGVNLFRAFYRETFVPGAPWLHTRNIGVPWGGAYPGFWNVLKYIGVPRWPFLIHVVYEPALCVSVGLLLYKASPLLGGYLVAAGVALCVKMRVLFFTYRETLRDVNDQVVASRAIQLRSGKSSRKEMGGEVTRVAVVAVPSWENVEAANEEASASEGADESEKETTAGDKAAQSASRYSCPKCAAPLTVSRTSPAIQCRNCKSLIRVSPKRHVAVA